VYINTKGPLRAKLYEDCSRKDLITKIKPLLTREGYHLRPDGKIDKVVQSSAFETPWIHLHQDHLNDCGLWHRIVFAFWHIMPSYCQNCWKVVLAPKTFEELLDVYEVLKEFGHPSKCGIELRLTDTRKYGGYLYNQGREQGENTYMKIKKKLPQIPALLKCACTEYEMEFGPPAEVEITDEQRWMEDWIKKWIVIPNEVFTQPEHLQAYVMLKWIHHAKATGDLTYKVATGGHTLSREIKTYHQEIDDGKVAK
jgi:hypothetical protein